MKRLNDAVVVLVVSSIRAYQRWISPLLGQRCRFEPSCSHYTAEAVAKHGLLLGSSLGVWRIIRCNPFSRGGLDLVPERTRLHTSFIPGQRH